jgi:signal peptidase I
MTARKYIQPPDSSKPNNRRKGCGCLKSLFILILLFIFAKAFFIDFFKIPTGSMEKTLQVGDYIAVNKFSYKLSTPHTIPFTEVDIPYTDLVKLKELAINDVIVFNFPGQLNELYPPFPFYYVKRVIGRPGDTVEIRDRIVYVNRVRISNPPGTVFNTEIIKKGLKDSKLFSVGKNWNIDNYGPIKVPQRGDIIDLNKSNIGSWGMMINRELDMKTVSTEGSVITINDVPVKNYTFRKNYYFVLGDNREDSMDSRYWGFVPEDAVIGKAILVYWSWDPFISISKFNALYKSIKWDRIFKTIK